MSNQATAQTTLNTKLYTAPVEDPVGMMPDLYQYVLISAGPNSATLSGVFASIDGSLCSTAYTATINSGTAVGFAQIASGMYGVLTAVTSSSSITSVTVTTAGQNYWMAPLLSLSGGGGSGGSLTANVSNGSITSITVVAAGSGYTAAPTVSITPSYVFPTDSNQVSAAAFVGILTGNNVQVGNGGTKSFTFTYTPGAGYPVVPTGNQVAFGRSNPEAIGNLGGGTPTGQGGEQLTTDGGNYTTALSAWSAKVIKSQPGRLCKVLVTTALPATAVTIYDNTSAAGTIIGVIPASSAVGTLIDFNMPAAIGIYISASASGAITLSYS